MVSPEVLRRYPLFAGLALDEVQTLAKLGRVVEVEADHIFFRENDKLRKLYLNIEGTLNVFLDTPKTDVEHHVSQQLLGDLEVEETIVSVIRPGELFGWSSLLEPFEATAGVKTQTYSRVVAFDSLGLLKSFEGNCHFGYRMLEKIAKIIHQRLHDRRVESLAHAPL